MAQKWMVVYRVSDGRDRSICREGNVASYLDDGPALNRDGVLMDVAGPFLGSGPTQDDQPSGVWNPTNLVFDPAPPPQTQLEKLNEAIAASPDGGSLTPGQRAMVRTMLFADRFLRR